MANSAKASARAARKLGAKTAKKSSLGHDQGNESFTFSDSSAAEVDKFAGNRHTGMNLAVDVVDVSKRFRLYHEKYQSLKERTLHAGRNTHEDFWALRDINFEVAEGETVGILGRNGSGKSTLLKCISGILQPTSGEIRVRGHLAALLELGAGFQSELSGRDNVFLNAALLGLSQKEMERRFDDIVAFAELEHFIDNQVKFYSSGMYVRLGFAVAVNVDPDVLVIDEVLAVGDENFQRKCLDRIKSFQEEGRTILFVTHAADMVRQICDRAVVLAGGTMLHVGPPGEAIRRFREHLLEVGSTADVPALPDSGQVPAVAAQRRVFITSVDSEHPGTGSRPYLEPREPLTVHVAFEALEPTPDVVFSIAVHDAEGNLIHQTDTEILNVHCDAAAGSGRMDFFFESVPLMDGTFLVSVGVTSRRGVVYDWREQATSFEVMNPGRSVGAVELGVRAEIRSAAFS
jgi:ABC-2 type transport system ATP-binding protein